MVTDTNTDNTDTTTPPIVEKDSAPAPYRVLARKYRPRTFAELLGQDAMVQTLTNAFAAGRIAQAYMLTGVRGIGKTTTARLIARSLNYTTPDGASQPSTDMSVPGEHCEAILESRHVDVIEMDAASNTSVDNMREIIESVKYKPVSAPYKVYIIDEVHMLSKSAFNALLKTLEEPPEHVKFIFATTEIRKVPVTVLSRCQRFDLRRLDAGLLIEHFTNVVKAEGVEAEPEALAMIARAAEGSVRDGLSLLDQAIAFGGRKVLAKDVLGMLGLVDRNRVIDLFRHVLKGDAAAALGEVEEQYNLGGDPHTILNDFAVFTHWVTKIKLVPEAADNPAYSEAERTAGAELAKELSIPVLTRVWQMALKGLGEVAMSGNPLMAAEMVFIRMAYAAELPPPGELVKKLKDAKPASSAAAASPPPAGKATTGASARVMQMSPQVQSRPQTQKEPRPAPEKQAQRSHSAFSSFKDIADYAGKMRDLKLKHALERYVRPVSVSPGKVEIALEKEAPGSLAGELSRKLEAWTGERWMVMVAPAGGEAPIAQKAREEKDNAFRRARAHPVTEAVFARFPGAEITGVHDPASAVSPEPHDDEYNEDSEQ